MWRNLERWGPAAWAIVLLTFMVGAAMLTLGVILLLRWLWIVLEVGHWPAILWIALAIVWGLGVVWGWFSDSRRQMREEMADFWAQTRPQRRGDPDGE